MRRVHTSRRFWLCSRRLEKNSRYWQRRPMHIIPHRRRQTGCRRIRRHRKKRGPQQMRRRHSVKQRWKMLLLLWRLHRRMLIHAMQILPVKKRRFRMRMEGFWVCSRKKNSFRVKLLQRKQKFRRRHRRLQNRRQSWMRRKQS